MNRADARDAAAVLTRLLDQVRASALPVGTSGAVVAHLEGAVRALESIGQGEQE